MGWIVKEMKAERSFVCITFSNLKKFIVRNFLSHQNVTGTARPTVAYGSCLQGLSLSTQIEASIDHRLSTMDPATTSPRHQQTPPRYTTPTIQRRAQNVRNNALIHPRTDFHRPHRNGEKAEQDNGRLNSLIRINRSLDI